MKRAALAVQLVLGLAMIGVAIGGMSGDVPRWAGEVAARAKGAGAPGEYGIVTLGWGAAARVHDINAVGAIAGSAYHEGGPLYAALWRDGETTEFHAVETNISGEAMAITDDGAVAYTVYADSGSNGRAYVAEPGEEPVCINDLIPGALQCRVRALNSSHQAVGTVSFPEGTRTFTWSPEDGAKVLDAPSALGMGINDAGVIVGSDGTLNPAGLPCMWVPKSDGTYETINLSADTGVDGRAYSINNAGVAVGRMSGPVPVVWPVAGEMQVLPGLPNYSGGWAYDVNDHGDIVGCVNCTGGGRAVLWRDGKAFDLNRCISQPDRWRLIEATAINNDGAITCRATFDDEATAVLLVLMEREQPVRMAWR
ncbi:MAG: hypothetical protein GF393_08645 [Armatimonadia bacterium]|nr:hypothetical protein [Armatimonadia bacterium]